jgi:hypothetical protein
MFDSLSNLFAKARVELVTFRPHIEDEDTREQTVRKIRAVEKLLREYGELLVDACKRECPVRSGNMRDSIRYRIENRDSVLLKLVVSAGNSESREVAIRSVLFGRRGFKPKRARALRFVTRDGRVIYTARVRGTLANDWFARAWNATANARRTLARRIGDLSPRKIAQSDVPLKNAPNIAGYKPNNPRVIPNTRRNIRRNQVFRSR